MSKFTIPKVGQLWQVLDTSSINIRTVNDEIWQETRPNHPDDFCAWEFLASESSVRIKKAFAIGNFAEARDKNIKVFPRLKPDQTFLIFSVEETKSFKTLLEKNRGISKTKYNLGVMSVSEPPKKMYILGIKQEDLNQWFKWLSGGEP